jgi:hypothetical protein
MSRLITESHESTFEKLSFKLHYRLINIGKKNETFDDIIKEYVKAYKDKTDRKYEPRT